MVFLSRILEKALADSGQNPAAHFLAGELLDFFSCILQCFHDGDEMEHAEALPLFSDLLKEEYLWSEELKEKGKLGGQHKVPRLSNTRDYIEEMLSLNQ